MAEEKKVTVETIAKELCPECGAHLFKVDGERTVLIRCMNHRKASDHKMKGTGTCNYQHIQDKHSFYERK